jgi:hypothetical protein
VDESDYAELYEEAALYWAEQAQVAEEATRALEMLPPEEPFEWPPEMRRLMVTQQWKDFIRGRLRDPGSP